MTTKQQEEMNKRFDERFSNRKVVGTVSTEMAFALDLWADILRQQIENTKKVNDHISLKLADL